MMTLTSDTLQLFERLAVQAGAEILAVRATPFGVAEKTDGSPVTLADERAEAVIVAGLRARFSTVPIVAEELVSQGVVPTGLGSQFFLVDALDGTKEFCAGRDEFTVNIALVRDGAPIVGVVYSPASGTMYSGYHDGAGEAQAARTRIGSGGGAIAQEPISARVSEATPTIVATRSHMNSETKAFLDQHPRAETRSIGSSLKFCILAAGEADIYPRFGTTMEWDTAAGDAVLRAAGGSTIAEDGHVLTYGKRGRPGIADFQNPHFIARGCRS
jgi:3'(2'), 5'-bisphosphate nucleotidase